MQSTCNSWHASGRTQRSINPSEHVYVKKYPVCVILWQLLWLSFNYAYFFYPLLCFNMEGLYFNFSLLQ